MSCREDVQVSTESGLTGLLVESLRKKPTPPPLEYVREGYARPDAPEVPVFTDTFHVLRCPCGREQRMPFDDVSLFWAKPCPRCGNDSPVCLGYSRVREEDKDGWRGVRVQVMYYRPSWWRWWTWYSRRRERDVDIFR